MLPGQHLLRRFSPRGPLLSFPTLLSGNTFDARFWSDGRCLAPMLPQDPPLCRCPEGDTLHWVEDGEPVGELGWGAPVSGRHPEFGRYLERALPTEADWHRALELGLDSTRQRQLRLLIGAWQAANDTMRELSSPPDPAFFTPIRERLLTQLAEASAEVPELHPARVEMLRALGRFEEARAALQALGDEIAPAFVQGTLARLAARDRHVFELS